MFCRDHKNGYTALMFAAIEGDEIIVDILVACVSWNKSEANFTLGVLAEIAVTCSNIEY